MAKLSSHKHRSAALLALAVVGPALTILLSQTYGQPLPMDPQQPWAVAELQGLRGPCQVSRRANVSLGQDERQVMDLYVPDRPNGAAALVIHGGAWRGGSKDGSGMVLIAGVLASHGFVAAAVNYRLAPTYKWPAQLQDCQLAVRWLRENADMLGIHADRIGALGTSAGGHLAAMLALVDGDLAAGCKVQAACNYFGPSDLLSHSSWSGYVRMVTIDLLGVTPEVGPQQYAQASPLTHVDAADPPVQICQGAQDNVVPPEQAQKLYEALQARKVPTELILLPNQGHGFLQRLRSDAEVQECFSKSVAWLKRWLVGGRSEE